MLSVCDGPEQDRPRCQEEQRTDRPTISMSDTFRKVSHIRSLVFFDTTGWNDGIETGFLGQGMAGRVCRHAVEQESRLQQKSKDLESRLRLGMQGKG